ncbi:MAG: efflux RND transporter permease subunit [Verrucomicrobiota bacterium]
MTDEASKPEKSEAGGLTGFAVRNSVTVLVIVALLLLSGVTSYKSMPKQQDPGFIIRSAQVVTNFPGASAEKVELLVSDQIEEVIQEIPELDYVTSKSRSGVSIITVSFLEKYKDMRPLFDKLRRKVEDLKDEGGLPSGTFGPFVNDEYGDVYGILYALAGEGFSEAEMSEIAEAMRNDLLKLPDVAKVEIHGDQDEVIFVEYNGTQLQQTGLTPSALSAILSSSNILESGGDIRFGNERIVLEPSGNLESLKALSETVIALPSGGFASLGDLTTIRRDYVDPPESLTRYNGNGALVLAISLRDGGDILKLNEQLDAVVPGIEAKYPLGVTLKKVFSQPKLVEESVSSFMNNLVQAVAIVAGVMFFFLGFRTGLIVASLIPTTILVTFVAMSYFGITVNQISLAALIIALGLLVDNAIVMAEAIMIRRENGEDKVRAAIAAGNEMATPLLISSLTTAAAFLSIFLAESSIGEYTADIFKVVTIALLSSWLLAMTFIPIMTIAIMKIKAPEDAEGSEKKEPYSGLMYRLYRGLLFPSLRFKIAPLAIVVILFFVAIWALRFVPQVFIPERRDPIINAKFDFPRGTDIAVTQAMMEDIEAYMLKEHSADLENDKSGIVDILSFIGVGTPRFVLAISPDPTSSHRGAMIIQLDDFNLISDIITDVQSYVADNYPDLEVKMRKMENGTPIDYPIEIRVSGEDKDSLYEIIGPIKKELLATPGVREVSDDWGQRVKKFAIEINEDRAQRAGVTNSDVAMSLETGLSGLEMTEFRDGNDTIPITLRSISNERQDFSKLESLAVYSQNSGISVPLGQVADINLVFDLPFIKRRDRSPTITVRTQHFPGVTATEVSSAFLPWLEENKKTWPPGYSYELGGEMETSSDASESIAAKLPISGMLIILLLVAQFNSVKKPLIILCTIPLGMVGVTSGLLIGQSIFGFFTILGVISLAGIIINNAIVLIDRINIELDENGREPPEAVIEACQQRLRPILITTATTVGGMLPLWISRDPMFETLAIAVMFGLLFATVLTLVVVPVLYSLLFGVKYEKLGG